MKNKFKLFLVLVVGLLLLPTIAHAETYNTLDLKGTLAEEEIEEKFTKYEPNKDAITVYLFRGKGCGYCHAFLEFMNSITEEYGKYFKLQSYEIWYDEANANLMNEVSTYMGEKASGVPYIIIGDQVFAGYASEYDESIKEAITTLYNTKKKDRYDVFTEMKKNPKKDGTTSGDINKFLIWNIAFIAFASIVLMAYTNARFKEINHKLNALIDEKATSEKPKSSKKTTKNKK